MQIDHLGTHSIHHFWRYVLYDLCTLVRSSTAGRGREIDAGATVNAETFKDSNTGPIVSEDADNEDGDSQDASSEDNCAKVNAKSTDIAAAGLFGSEDAASAGTFGGPFEFSEGEESEQNCSQDAGYTESGTTENLGTTVAAGAGSIVSRDAGGEGGQDDDHQDAGCEDSGTAEHLGTTVAAGACPVVSEDIGTAEVAGTVQDAGSVTATLAIPGHGTGVHLASLW